MIKDEDIELVRSSVNMQDLVARYGYKISRGGYIKCPFHADHNPSCRIYPGDKGFYCFTCHEGGDAIWFVRCHDNLGFEPSVRKLAGMFGIPLSDGNTSISEDDRQRILKQKHEREAARKASEVNVERLQSVSRQLHKLRSLQTQFEPLGAVWCYIQRSIEKLEREWDFRFHEKPI